VHGFLDQLDGRRAAGKRTRRSHRRFGPRGERQVTSWRLGGIFSSSRPAS
jgi:hypothetical protein